MELVGGDPQAEPHGIEPLAGTSHYLIGSNPDSWTNGVSHFGGVQYDDVYTGIDLVYYGNQRQLEYDFVVDPGADPGVIELSFDGAERIEVDPSGDLVLETDDGQIRLPKPFSYQELDGVRQEIVSGYQIGTEGTVTFQLDEYDVARELVIDPVVTYSTYLGGSGIDTPYDIMADGNGNAYIVGRTLSVDFPTSTGALQPSSGGQFDVFITKLDPTGSSVVFSTYFGGSSHDYAKGIAQDEAGNIYVAGSTESSNLPITAGALQPTRGGSRDAFIAKFDPTGSTLLYSTFLGGSKTDETNSIAVTGAGLVYITGRTSSENLPTTATAVQTSNAGIFDTFVAVVDPDPADNSPGSSGDPADLLYSTYLGGFNDDDGEAIAVDSSGIAHITGSTNSFDQSFPGNQGFPVTGNALQPVIDGGASRARWPRRGLLHYRPQLVRTGFASLFHSPRRERIRQ